MKRLSQLMAVVAVLVALTGCLDPQDESGGRPKAQATFELK
jgi:hypothetical protein